MRTKAFLILVLILLNINIKAQRSGDLRIVGFAEVSHFNTGTLTSYGVFGEVFISRSFSLNYQYTFGTNQYGNFYSHYPGAVSWFVESVKYYDLEYATSESTDFWIYVLAATALVPEGISFHAYPRKWLEIAPFLNPFSTDYNILDNNHSTITASLGIRAHAKLGRHFSVVPHFGLKHIYKTSDNGNFYGLGIGWLF